jgi:glycosyltransferase 2 family protein
MDPGEQETKRWRLPSWLPQVLGYTVSAACLVWVLHGYDLHDVTAAIRALDWRWVTVSVLLDLSVYLVHGWRWNTLLSPVARLPFWRTVQAIYIGIFANEILPLRTGELIRCYLLAHWNSVLLSLAFASAAIERLIDGFWMTGAFLVTAHYVELPGYMTDFVRVLAGLLTFGALLFGWVVTHKQRAHAVARESRWASTLRHLVEGLHDMGNPRSLARTILISFVYLVVQALSVWALMRAYGLDLSLLAAAGVLTIVRLGTVIPNAPGNVGLFQAVTVLALSLFEVERNDAKTFSFIMFFAMTIPLLVGGAVAVALTGLNIKEIHRRARTHAGSHPERDRSVI